MRRVSFRIGLHVGEAIVRNGDLFGDGVNVAARMQGLARPGSVCLSESAHQYARRVPSHHATSGDRGEDRIMAPLSETERCSRTLPLGDQGKRSQIDGR